MTREKPLHNNDPSDENKGYNMKNVLGNGMF